MQYFRLILLLIFERCGHMFAFWTDEEIPVHMQAVFDRTAEEKRLVDFIVQFTGSWTAFGGTYTHSSLQIHSK